MKQLLSVYGKAGTLMAVILGVITFLILMCLICFGDEMRRNAYIGGLAGGYVAGAVWLWSLTSNVSSAEFNTEDALKKIGNGGFVRISTLGIILASADMLGGDECFFMAIVGYFLFLFMSFAGFIASRFMKKDKGDTN